MLPHGVIVRTVNINWFEYFHDNLSGPTADNLLAVQAKPVELGLSLAPVTN